MKLPVIFPKKKYTPLVRGFFIMNTKIDIAQNEAQNLVPDLTNPEEARRAFLAAEILNRKY